MFNIKKFRILSILLVALLVSTLLVAGCGQKAAEVKKEENTQKNEEKQQEKFPTKPITLIVPYSAGGGSDLTSRMLASLAKEHLGVPINIVNMPGGSGAIGYAELLKRPNDGYTLSSCTSTIVTMKLLKVLDFNHTAFDIVIGFNYEPAAIGVNTELAKKYGWNNLEDFIKYSKQHPGEISMGTTAVGGIWNVGTHAAQDAIGLEWNVIPAGGGGAKPIIQCAGGKIEAVTAGPLEIYTQEQAGKMKLLGVMSDERLDAYPDVPTFKENGYDVSVTTTRSLLAPKGVPQERLEILYEAFKKAAESEKYKEFCKSKGGGYMSDNGETMMKFYDEQEKVFAKIIK